MGDRSHRLVIEEADNYPQSSVGFPGSETGAGTQWERYSPSHPSDLVGETQTDPAMPYYKLPHVRKERPRKERTSFRGQDFPGQLTLEMTEVKS